MKNILLILIILLNSCTKNQLVKNFGSTETIEVRQNHIILNATWKGDQLWILTKDTTTGICYFKERSSWGITEGEVIFK